MELLSFFYFFLLPSVLCCDRHLNEPQTGRGNIAKAILICLGNSQAIRKRREFAINEVCMLDVIRWVRTEGEERVLWEGFSLIFN
jgi:hypothetical protein